MEPTNADLKKSFDAHALDDHAFQEKSSEFNGEMAMFKAETEGSLATIHDKLNGLATKEDMDEVKTILKAARVTAGIFNFTFDNASKIGSFILFFIGGFLILKYGIMGAIAWFFGKAL